MSKCKNGVCEIDKPDTSIVEQLEAGQHVYSFPWLGVNVIATDLDDANKKVEAMLNNADAPKNKAD